MTNIDDWFYICLFEIWNVRKTKCSFFKANKNRQFVLKLKCPFFSRLTSLEKKSIKFWDKKVSINSVFVFFGTLTKMGEKKTRKFNVSDEVCIFFCIRKIYVSCGDLLFYNVAQKRIKKKRKKERKIERLNLKNIQNVRKFFLNIFLLGFWPKKALTCMKLIYFLKLVSVKILLKMNAHQKAKQKTYLDVHNKNSFTIIHREWRYELFETKCF